MFCKNCGKEIKEGALFCENCGTKTTNDEEKSESTSSSKVEHTRSKNSNFNVRCLPSFIIGLLGSVFGLFGGLCTTMCSCGYASNEAFFLIFGGSVIGMIGTCLCLNKAHIGSIIQLVAAIMIISKAYSTGSDFMSVIALLFLLVSALIGIVYSFFPLILKIVEKAKNKK